MAQITTSKRLKTRVLMALSSNEDGLRTSEIAGIVGASVTATRAALEAIGAVKVAEAYPTEWTIDGTKKPSLSKVVPSKFTGVEYVVTSKEVSDIVSAWNEQCAALGEAISRSTITSDSNTTKSAKDLGTLAGSIVALAFALSEVAGKPDWLDILTPDK